MRPWSRSTPISRRRATVHSARPSQLDRLLSAARFQPRLRTGRRRLQHSRAAGDEISVCTRLSHRQNRAVRQGCLGPGPRPPAKRPGVAWAGSDNADVDGRASLCHGAVHLVCLGDCSSGMPIVGHSPAPSLVRPLGADPHRLSRGPSSQPKASISQIRSVEVPRRPPSTASVARRRVPIARGTSPWSEPPSTKQWRRTLVGGTGRFVLLTREPGEILG